jgi:hypothetical protein
VRAVLSDIGGVLSETASVGDVRRTPVADWSRLDTPRRAFELE